MAKIDLTGNKYGRLTVLYEAPSVTYKCGCTIRYWHCKCECGNEKDVQQSALTCGSTKSCGCFKKESDNSSNVKLKRYNRYEIKDDYVVMYTLKNEPFYIDLEDLDKVKNYCWYLNKSGGYVVSNKTFGGGIRLHRLIMDVLDKPQLYVDHVNHDVVDNRKSNLRIVNQSNNGMNNSLRKNNKTGVTGVYFNSKRNKWRAEIMVNYKHINLGQFNNFNDAVIARKKAEEKYFGEYSYDNSLKVSKKIK